MEIEVAKGTEKCLRKSTKLIRYTQHDAHQREGLKLTVLSGKISKNIKIIN